MPSPFIRKEFPKTLSRQRWSISLKVGLDVSDILGLGSVETAAGLTSLIQNNLQNFGSVESFEIDQGKDLYERFALGPDSAQPFQVTPMQIKTALKLSRVLLKNMENAQQVFNFYPNNLIHQQLPFVIEAIDPGDGVNLKTQVIHYFFGCWFTDSNIKYEVTSREDQRLIHTVSVKVGRTLTLDNSIGGNAVVNAAQNILGGVLVASGPKSLISKPLSFI